MTASTLPLYYSGCLQMKRKAEKNFKDYMAELRGAMLFLYGDKLEDTCTETLDLEELKSIELNKRKIPVTFTLRMTKEEVQLQIKNPNSGEEWRCYILTVSKKEIPSKFQLLPGQMLKLQEVLFQEMRRTQPLPSPPLPPRPSSVPPAPALSVPQEPVFPSCFFRVTRQEAEQMLEENPKNGALIIRPSSMAHSYAVTLRLQTPSGRVMRNYRVSSTKSGFVIELGKPVTVSSLHDVVHYFQEKTGYSLPPYSPSELYDTWIDVQAAPAPRPEAVDSAYLDPDSCSGDGLKLVGTAPVKEDGVLKLWSNAVYLATNSCYDYQ